MKILFPVNVPFYPAQGGPSNVVYWIAKALRKKNVVATIIATNSEVEGKIALDQWIDTDYGRVIYHTSHFLLFPWRMIASTLAAIPRCNVLHLTSLFYPSSILFATAAVWYDKPIIWSPHGELYQKALQYSTWKKKPILQLIRRLFAKKVVFHTTSPEETERVKTVMGPYARVIEIPNFMELPVLIEPSSSIEPYLLYIGRIHPIKAIGNLIMAMADSSQIKATGMNLIIAGDCNNNPYADKLQQQVRDLGLQERVQFIGAVDGEEKQQLYANAYFLILPSDTENFGNVVVESLAQGTPVIASTGTPWSILEQEQAGLWVSNTPAALTSAIEETLNLSPKKYQQYRTNALALARQHFDVYENVGKWMTAYQQASTSETIILKQSPHI